MIEMYKILYNIYDKDVTELSIYLYDRFSTAHYTYHYLQTTPLSIQKSTDAQFHTAFAWSPVVTMLGPPCLDGHELSVISFDRKRHAQHRIARFDYAQSAAYDRQLLVLRQPTTKRVCQTIFHQASGLVKEFIYRICESILTSSSGSREQVVSATSQCQDARRS